jgi:multicomponent Na+:H+ antiporter subunit D
MTDHLPVLPVVTSLVGAMLVPVLGLRAPRRVPTLARLTAAAATAASLGGLGLVLARGSVRYAVAAWPPPWGIELVLDPLSAFMAVTISSTATVALAVAGRSPGDRPGGPAFYALALVFLAGLLGIVVSGDLFNVFVFLELAAIASYALVASAGGPALLAGFRYLILGTVGGSFYLLGVGLLYAVTGTLNIADLSARAAEVGGSPALLGGATFVLVGLAVKAGLFPLHAWLPDAYTHAAPAVVNLVAPIGTKAALYLMARLLVQALDQHGTRLAGVLLWAGAAAVVVGGVLALRQRDGRRLLAYSSVSHAGYIALGLGLGNVSAQVGAYLHILAHALAKAALFVAVGAAAATGRGTRVGAIGRAAPLTAASAVVAALTLVGVPPSGGFFSKWYLLRGAVEAGQYAAAAVVLVGGLLAAGYAYRLTERVWFPDGDDGAGAGEAPAPVLAGLALLAGASLGIGLASPALVEALLAPAARP